MQRASRKLFGSFALVLALTASGCVSSGQKTASLPEAPPPAAVPAVSGDPSLDRLIAKHAQAQGVPLALAHAVVQVESRYNPRATGRGTIGLMQIKPATARSMGYAGSAQGLYDPDTNLTYGMRYLGRAYALGGGDVCGAILRYAGGLRATRMTKGTAGYCAKVKTIMTRTA